MACYGILHCQTTNNNINNNNVVSSTMTITSSLSQVPTHLSSVYKIQRGGDGNSGYSYSNHSGNTAVEADDIIATFTDELQKMRMELEQEAELEMAQAKSDLLKSLKRRSVKNERVNARVETEEDHQEEEEDDGKEEDPKDHVQVQGNNHDISSSQEPFKDVNKDDGMLHNVHDEEEYEIQYEYEEIELEEYDEEQLQEKMDAHSIDVDNCNDEIQIGDSEDLEVDTIVIEEDDVPEKNVVEEEVVEKTPKTKKKKDKQKKKNKQKKKDKQKPHKSTRKNKILEQQLHLEKKKEEEESTLMILVKSLVPVLMVALLMILSHLLTQLLMKKM